MGRQWVLFSTIPARRSPRWRGRIAPLVDASRGAGCRGGGDARRKPARTGDAADAAADYDADSNAACRFAANDPDRDTTDGTDHRTVVRRGGAAQPPRIAADLAPDTGDAIVADATRHGDSDAAATADGGNATNNGDPRSGLPHSPSADRAANHSTDRDASRGHADTDPDRDKYADDHTDGYTNGHADRYTNRYAGEYPKPGGDRGARASCAAR